ncbi:MAG: hypothetical protein GXX86_06540 [Propionibacterium sp.]|nr:hypothetical protein [Propionibacterium sp.]
MSDDPIAVLTRWTDSGAHWRVAARTAEAVIIELITCTGDEVVDRLHTTDPDLVAWLGDRRSSFD